MGVQRVQGGKRLRWKGVGSQWFLQYDGKTTARVQAVAGGGAVLEMVPHPRLETIPYQHWFPSLRQAKQIALASVQIGLERSIRHAGR